MKKLCAILLSLLTIALLISCADTGNGEGGSETTNTVQTTLESITSTDTQSDTDSQGNTETNSDTDSESNTESSKDTSLEDGDLFENDNEATYNDAWN